MHGPIAAKGPSLAAQACSAIERLILAGQLAPGERLSEVALAARLKISRGPLREALRLLERDGLVVAGARYGGTFVRRLDAGEVAELYDTRALLQGFCCARLAGRASAADIALLRRQIAAMAETIDDAEAFYRLNVGFHRALFDAAGHRRTAAIYRGLEKESHLGRRQTMRHGDNRRASNDEHRAIVDAIAAGDAAAAREAGEAHVLAGKRRWLAGLVG